ncbi:MAG: hypothetical protein IIW26_05925 [Tidjanibacter sp.]|nr:hypothetical protein [Tidjanibacter sp.]
MKKSVILATLLGAVTLNANAQENISNNTNTQQTETMENQEKKEGFLKRAFRDMKESAKLQHKIDKANYEATKLESKAFYQEQKRLSNPKVRTAAEKARMEQELEAAEQRKAEAQAKLDSIKNN